MANTRLADERARAEKLYRSGVTSPTDIGKTLGVRRQTVSKWINEGQWEQRVARERVTPEEIVDEIVQVMSIMIKDMREKKASGEIVSLQSLKELIGFSKALKNISDEWDIRGSMLVFAKRFSEFAAMLPNDVLPQKKAFLEQLREVMPLFMQHVEAND